MKKKVKDGKVLKIFTLNKLLTRLPILLRQIIWKESIQIEKRYQKKYCNLYISMIKSLKKFATI